MSQTMKHELTKFTITYFPTNIDYAARKKKVLLDRNIELKFSREAICEKAPLATRHTKTGGSFHSKRVGVSMTVD